MHKRRQVVLAVHRSVILVDIIAHNGKHFFFAAFNVPVGSIVAAAVTEAYNHGKIFLRLFAIECRIPVRVKILHHIFTISLEPFFIKGFVRIEKAVELSVLIKAAEPCHKLRLIHLCPSLVKRRHFFVNQRESAVPVVQM